MCGLQLGIGLDLHMDCLVGPAALPMISKVSHLRSRSNAIVYGADLLWMPLADHRNRLHLSIIFYTWLST